MEKAKEVKGLKKAISKQAKITGLKFHTEGEGDGLGEGEEGGEEGEEKGEEEEGKKGRKERKKRRKGGRKMGRKDRWEEGGKKRMNFSSYLQFLIVIGIHR